ncbi:MAG: cytoplasmic protein, partial [Myxococcota bacterium]
FRSGPTGGSLSDVRPGKTIVASRDTLAADAFGWDDLLQRKDEELPNYFAQATARKLGNPDWRALSIKEVQIG